MMNWINVKDRRPEDGKTVDMHLIRREAEAIIRSFRYDFLYPGKFDGRNGELLLTHWREVQPAAYEEVLEHFHTLPSEQNRQQMVMMGPGFMSSGGSIFGPMIAFAIGGWAVALVLGLCWLIFG